MPGRKGSRCLTRQELVASYSRALVVTAATATTLRAAVLLRRMSLSRSRVFPGVCAKAHEGVFQGAMYEHLRMDHCSISWPQVKHNMAQ